MTQISTVFAQSTPLNFDQSGTGVAGVLWTPGYAIVGGAGYATDVLQFVNNGLPSNPVSAVNVYQCVAYQPCYVAGPNGNSLLVMDSNGKVYVSPYKIIAGSDTGASYAPLYSNGDPGSSPGDPYSFNYVKTPPPVITSVTPVCSDIFLAHTDASVLFTVGVNWNGDPGQVYFSCNGTTVADVTGNSSGATCLLNMGALPPGPGPLHVVAVNSQGRGSAPYDENICIAPPSPTWLSLSPISSDGCDFTYSARFATPNFSNVTITIPDWVPVAGGVWGLQQAYFKLAGPFSTAGGGSLNGSGALNLLIRNSQVGGEGFGAATLALDCTKGLSLNGGSGTINLAATWNEPISIFTLFPELAPLEAIEYYGGAIGNFVKNLITVTPKATLEATLQLSFATQTDGTIGYQGTLAPQWTFAPSLDFNFPLVSFSLRGKEYWNANFAFGDGVSLEQAKVGGELGFEVKLNYLFAVGNAQYGKNIPAAGDIGVVCNYPPSPINCQVYHSTATPSSASASHLASTAQSRSQPEVSIIRRAYRRFGEYSKFHPNARKPTTNGNLSPASASSSSGTTLISNLFPGASPETVNLKDGRQLLLWVAQDLTLPVTQSTGIMWSIQDGSGNWSTPQLIVADTQAEFSPVAAIDANGLVMAAWLRVKDPNFPASVSSTDDIGQFYKDFEVVTADFDPATQTWTAVTALTDDTALDTDLQLNSDGRGNVLLSWLSNPDAELLSTTASPSSLKISVRSGGSWAAPLTLASNLVGVSHHVAAVYDTNAFVIVARDPDITSPNNGVLDLYRCTGGTWSGPEPFAGGGVDNGNPVAAYDSNGMGYVAWQQGSNFVAATLTNPTPTNVDTSGSCIGFCNVQFIAGPSGRMLVTYEQPTSDGPAALYTYVYDPAGQTWSPGPQLSENGAMVSSYSASIDSSEQLRIAYLATQIIPTATTITAGGLSDTVNLPIDGETDLLVASLNVTTMESQLTSAVSRKVHGPAGTFDLNLPLTGKHAIECRSGGPTGQHNVIATFQNALTSVMSVSATATTTTGTADLNSVPTGNIIQDVNNNPTNQYSINLAGVPNASHVVITLHGVTDSAGNSGDVVIPMDVLLGDTTGDGTVNSADISQTKSQSGQSVGPTNFRNDVTIDGGINSADISLVKSESGTGLP